MVSSTYKIGGVTYWRDFEPKKVGNFRDCLGEVLREERNRQGVTQRSIEGIALGYVSEIERGVKEASSEVLEAYCGSLNIGIAEVLRRTADKMEK